MIQREISELRRHMTPERTNMTHIYGCYVNGEKQIISSYEQSLAVMEKNDVEKYIELMKKALSGKIGRTLNNLEFTSQQVIDGEEHKLLMALRETKMEDAQLRETLCRKIIEVLSLNDQSNYLILLAYDVYDIPFKGSDRQTQMDNSDETFRYILCAVCPVKSRKAELGYDTGENQFHLDQSVPVVGAPELGFLFPAFDDRHTNIYNALFYSRDTAMMHREFIDAVFKTKSPMAPGEQKEAFTDAITEALEGECRFDVVRSVHQQIRDRMEEYKQAKVPEPLELSSDDVAEILRQSGVEEERVDSFREKCGEQFGEDAGLDPGNIIESRKFEIVTPVVKVSVVPEYTQQVKTKIVDGRMCLVIPVDGGVEVNGVPVYTENRAVEAGDALD